MVARLAGGTVRRGHRVAVIGVVGDPRAARHFFGALRDEGVEGHQLVVPERAYKREIDEVRSIIERTAPDVVHTHGYRADVVHAVAARQVGVPLVTTLHGFTGGGIRNRAYEWLQVRSVRRHAGVVAVSTPMAELLSRRGIPARVLHVIPNAWEARRPPQAKRAARAVLGVPQDAFHVGWVGRLSQEKGADVLLDALSRLEPGIGASIVGDGPMRSSLEEQSRRLGLHGVRFPGAVVEAGQLFPAFDAFVLSSRTEGTPIVLFEAMAASVPIVAASVGGVPDVISQASALLVPPEEPTALAAAIEQVRRDPSAAAGRAAEARRVLDERFSEGPWVEKYGRLYASVLRS